MNDVLAVSLNEATPKKDVQKEAQKDITPQLCRLIRSLYGDSRPQFSNRIGVSLSVIQKYEDSKRDSALLPNRINEQIPTQLIDKANELIEVFNAIES